MALDQPTGFFGTVLGVDNKTTPLGMGGSTQKAGSVAGIKEKEQMPLLLLRFTVSCLPCHELLLLCHATVSYSQLTMD